MTKDEEICAGLKASGVPELTFRTTLKLEGALELRALLDEKALVRPTSARGLYLYPKNRASTAHARKLFYLVAKELFLSGVTVCCLPLTRLVEALNAEDLSGEAGRIDRVRMVFVLDFYEEGAGFPFQQADAAKLRAWVRHRYEAGSAVSFLSDSQLPRCEPWWPQSFLGFITDNVVIHSV